MPLRLINVQLRTVLAVGGVGGLAVGLALQNLVQNLISGPRGVQGETWPWPGCRGNQKPRDLWEMNEMNGIIMDTTGNESG